MKSTTRNKIYVVDRTIRKYLKVVVGVCFVLLLLAAINTPLKRTFGYAFIAVGVLFLVLVLCRICLSPFVKSDEEEEMEEKVEYILRKHHADELQAVIEDYSPLCNLTPEQNYRVKHLLCELPPHPDKPDHINMAYMAQYLTALQRLGKARLEDKRNLRLWVAQVTGKKVPSPSQFNEAIPSKAVTKVANAVKTLEPIFN